jgi:[acyl-carrier-protein] S-malonyltransferase
MTLGLLFSGAGILTTGVGIELYERYPAMQRSFDDIQKWTGFTVAELLNTDGVDRPEQDGSLSAQVRQAALQFGSYDILTDMGIRPDVVGGVSLGGMVSASVAGSVRREDVFRLLLAMDDAPAPGPDEPAQGLAFALIPEGLDPAMYHADRPGVFVAGDFGRTADGGMRVLMLAGLREALQDTAAQVPPGTLIPLDLVDRAMHTPLRASAADFLAPAFDALHIAAPTIPLCSSLRRGTMTTAGDVRRFFHENLTSPAMLVDVCDEMKEHYDVRLAVVLGSSLAEGFLRFPFPVVHLTTPEHVVAVGAAAVEYGIDLHDPVG